MTAATARVVRSARVEPHVALAVAAALAVVAEAVYDQRTSDLWLVLEAAVGGLGLLVAWRNQDRLQLVPLLVVAFTFHLAYVCVHLASGVRGDLDSRAIYGSYGQQLLDGHYPRSEYPVGAVLVFAVEALINGTHSRVPNAFLMIPFQLIVVAAVWSLRTRWSPWLAALVALWPMNAFYWEFKFDLVAAGLLAAGLALAWRERWSASGVLLGAGALVKWTPGLAFLALAVWLVGVRRYRELRAHVLAFVLTVAVVYVPFLFWQPDNVLYAYRNQAGRTITPESIWYLPLHPLGLAQLGEHISYPAHAPHWADVLAIVVQVALLAAVLFAVSRAPRLEGAIALAALMPCAFLLTNRIFSPQFSIPLFASWAIAGALAVRDRREQLAVGVLAGVASLANAFVYPYALPHYTTTWQICSGVLFAAGLALTAALAIRAAR